MNSVLVAGAAAAFVCYVAVAASPAPGVSIAMCALCGLASSLLWPGTLVIAAEKYPLAGAWMFAILAAAGDIGAAAGPFAAGIITDFTRSLPGAAGWAAAAGMSPDQFAIRTAILMAAVFPALTLICHLALRRRQKDQGR